MHHICLLFGSVHSDVALIPVLTVVLLLTPSLQAYEGLQTAEKLREQYVFLPAKVKEVYLAHLLNNLAEHKVRLGQS